MEKEADSCNVGGDQSLEQKEWFCKFKELFGEESEHFIAMLKESGCYDVNNWKKNTKHVLHRWVHKECEDYNWAWKKIDRDRRKHGTKIHFAELNVRRIPSNIESMVDLRKLTIFHSNISIVPQEIEKLNKLEFLHIIQCPLYVLPETLGKLNNLKVLEVSQCRITEIPESVYSCPNLVHLLLDNNFLSSFRFDLIDKTGIESGGLKRLSLMGNRSIDFSPLQKSVDLSYLNLGETGIKMFSGSNLPSLKTLILSKQPEEQGEPTIVGDLSDRLSYLDVSGITVYESNLWDWISRGTKRIVLKATRIQTPSDSKSVLCKEWIQREETKKKMETMVPTYEFYRETFFASRFESDASSGKLASKLKKMDLRNQ